jgi:four helix bundle protein
MGSASEVEYHLLLARDLFFLDISLHSQLNEQVIEVKRMIASYSQKFKAKYLLAVSFQQIADKIE